MRLLALAYHDLNGTGLAEPSGFTGMAAESYKLTPSRFREHLSALHACRASNVFDVVFTFDDGGVSAMAAADALEQYGWRGSFFISTGWMSTSGFLTPGQIAELHARGHVIGSHGVTHQGRMTRMPDDVLAREWRESSSTLSAITGAAVLTASIPSGFFSPRVAEAAAGAGIRRLFTQKPVTRTKTVAGCEVAGRFTMRSWSTAAYVQALATRRRTRWQAAAWWRLREIAKAMPGSAYHDLRRLFFEGRSAAGPV